jgi:hypothetical protein
MNGHWWSVVVAWAVTVAGAAAVVILLPHQALALLPLLLALALVAAFVLQLVVADKEGLVARLTASGCGSLAIVLVAALLALIRR